MVNLQQFMMNGLCLVLLTISVPAAVAIPFEEFIGYPFGLEYGDRYFPRILDHSITIDISDSPFLFFNKMYPYIVMNVHGALSFQNFNTSFTHYVPEVLPLNRTENWTAMVAPFWSDTDIRPVGNLAYRILNESFGQDILDSISAEAGPFLKLNNFMATWGLIMTWYQIGYYNRHIDKLNTFQVVIATDGATSVTIFNYADNGIQWTMTDTGAALAGYNAGDGIRAFSISGFLTDEIGFLDSNPGNTGEQGHWIFRIDGGGGNEIVFKECSGTISFQPKHGNILGGTPVTVQLDSFCLTESSDIQCIYNGISYEGIFISRRSALCPSPSFDKTGYVPFQFAVSNGTTEIYRASQTFLILPFERAYQVDVSKADKDTLLLEENEAATVKWSTNLLPHKASDTYKVDITLYKFDFDQDKWDEVQVLKKQVNNSGVATVKLPKFGKKMKDSVFSNFESIPITFRVSTRLDTVKRRKRRQNNVIDVVREWASTYFLAKSKTDFKKRCLQWYDEEIAKIADIMVLANTLSACPPTRVQANLPNSGFEREHLSSYIAAVFESYVKRYQDFFHPNTSVCYRQSGANNGRKAGQQCCYDFNGNLLIGPPGGGTINTIAPIDTKSTSEHLEEDVLPFLYCCKAEQPYCDKYYQVRPSDNGSRYNPPNPACIYGDPHMVTLDGFKYTFNGKGEYILIQTDDSSFTLQGRMEEAPVIGSTDANATVFTALVAKLKDSDIVQFQIIEQLQIIINGEIVEFDDTIDVIPYKEVMVKKGENSSYSATFSNGIHIEVYQELNSNNEAFISTMIVSLPESFKGTTSGLMSSFNDDQSDDLLPKNGTTPLPLNSTLETIHWKFGITWIIDNEDDSLFYYEVNGESDSWGDYYDPRYTPAFAATFTNPDLKALAEEQCKGDQFCLYDIAATRDPKVGITTFEGGENLDVIINGSKPVSCDPPCDHGACVATNTCNCEVGYQGDFCEALTESKARETIEIKRIWNLSSGCVILWDIPNPIVDGFHLTLFEVDEGEGTYDIVQQTSIQSPVRAFHLANLKKGKTYQIDLRVKIGENYGSPVTVRKRF